MRKNPEETSLLGRGTSLPAILEEEPSSLEEEELSHTSIHQEHQTEDRSRINEGQGNDTIVNVSTKSYFQKSQRANQIINTNFSFKSKSKSNFKNKNKSKNAKNKGINVGHPDGARQKTKGSVSQPPLVLGPEDQPLNSMESDGETNSSVEIPIMEGEIHHGQVWEEHEQDHLSQEDGVHSQDGEHHRQRHRQKEHEQANLSDEDEVPSQEGEHHRQRRRQGVHDEGRNIGSIANNQNCQPQSQKVNQRRNKSRKYNTKAMPTPEPKTVTVLFVDQTVGGVLARRLQIAEDRLSKVTGYRVRITETSGSQLRRILPNTNPWQGMDCQRTGCYTCNQGGEKLENCKKRNILYESSCTLCNPEETAKASRSKRLSDCQGVYVGETGRSLHERAGEHWRDAQGKQEDSHIIKHWLTDHSDLGTPPKFRMKVVGSFTDALSRQLSEAVRIDLRGGGVLNSKTEYSRCRVPRLVVDMEEWKKKKIEEKKEVEGVPPPTTEDNINLNLEMENQAREIAPPTYEGKRKSQVGGPKGKRRKLEPLVDWGEVEGHDIWEDWLLKEDEVRNEMRNRTSWLVSKEVNIPNMKLKQMEIEFKKVLDVDMGKEVAVEGVTTAGLDQETTTAADPEVHISLEPIWQDDSMPTPTQSQTQTPTPTPSIDQASPYIRRTGKMTKKEKKELAAKNTKMTAWVSKSVKKIEPVQPVQESEDEVDMDWEVAPDVDKPWRKMVAQSKTAEYRRLLEVKRMVSGMIEDVVDSIESVSVINSIMETVIETSYVEGMTRRVWREMECNAGLKSSIKSKLMEEEEEERILMEAQRTAERRIRQEVARKNWLSSQEEKEMDKLAASLTSMAVSPDEPEKDFELDKDGDIEMRIEETEAEIDAWLSKLADEMEEDTITNNIKLDDEIMEIDNYEDGDETLDNNDTSKSTPESTKSSSYEEWVVRELDSFTVGAVTNLKVGLVDSRNYENGTWFVNRWISPKACQTQNQPQPQNCQPQNVQNIEDISCCLDRTLCQNNSKNNNTIEILSSNITAGSTHCCNLSRPRKRRRTRRSSTQWSSGTWSSTRWGAESRSSLTPGSSEVRNRIVWRGRRRLDSTVALPVSVSLTANTTHIIIWDHNLSGQGGGGGGEGTAEAHGGQGGSGGARAEHVQHVQGDQTIPGLTSTSRCSDNTHTMETDTHPSGQDCGDAAEGHAGRDDQCDGAQAGDVRRDQPQHVVEGAQVDRGQPSIGRSRPRKDFTIVKKRGIIPDGLVQRRLDSFVIAFPNLRRGGEVADSADRGGGVGIKRKSGT